MWRKLPLQIGGVAVRCKKTAERATLCRFVYG
jgi:hypothetical protein